jgi:hypothetical protein
VLVDDLEAPVRLDDALPIFNKIEDPNERLVSGSFVERGGTRAYERQLEDKEGRRTLDRRYAHGTKLITVAAFVSGVDWKGMEGEIREILDSVTILP